MASVTSGLKICIASSGLGHVLRGIEAWAADLGHALRVRGEDAIICKGGGIAEAEGERVIPCWTRTSISNRRMRDCLPASLAWRLGMGSGYGIEQTTFACRLIGELRREHVDILHLQDPQVAWIVQQAARAGLVRTRTILNHGTEEPLSFQRKIIYLQHGAPWHQQQAQSAGAWRSTWTMIPNFVDTELFSCGSSPAMREELGIPHSAIVVLVSSAIKRRHKRVDYLLREMAALRQHHPQLPVWLVIAGGSDESTPGLMEEAQQTLGAHVRFLINFARARMPELYRAADIFVHGSLKEMMPMALLEATASGVPCLVHRHPVMQWMIGPGGQALDLEQAGGLIAGLLPLVADVGLRRRLGELAREHCTQNFSTQRVIPQILNYYQQVHSGSFTYPSNARAG